MQTSQSTKERLKSLANSNKVNQDKIKKRRLLTSGTIIALFIIISPYFFYIYEGIPDIPVWDSPFGTITSNYYGSVQVLFWTLFNKVVPLFLLLIWFFTCRHWWYHAIIVPICMVIFQIFTILNDEIIIDSNEFLVLAPIIFVMLIFSYTIRTKIFDKIHGIDLSELGRGNWKGDLLSEEKSILDDDDDDEEPAFMA